MKEALNWLFSILFVMVLVLVVFTVGPMVETKYFPVYSKFTITNAVPTPEGLRVIASFTKFRNCNPQGYAWYLGDFGMGMRQLTTIQHIPYIPVNKPLGTQTTRPFEIKDLRIEDLPNVSAEIYNRCHPLWITRSVIYP